MMLKTLCAAVLLLLAGSAQAEPQKAVKTAAPEKAAPPCPKIDFTVADVPASCKSRDDKVVCGAGGCIDSIVEKVAPRLQTDYSCDVSETFMSNCLGPFIGPLASSGANLQALMKCDAATSTERIRAKNIIKCKKTDSSAADVAAAAPTKA